MRDEGRQTLVRGTLLAMDFRTPKKCKWGRRLSFLTAQQ